MFQVPEPGAGVQIPSIPSGGSVSRRSLEPGVSGGSVSRRSLEPGVSLLYCGNLDPGVSLYCGQSGPREEESIRPKPRRQGYIIIIKRNQKSKK